jgi:hypothetical protein
LNFQVIDNALGDALASHGDPLIFCRFGSGKHRGSTKTEIPGNSRNQDMLKNTHNKQTFERP